MWLSEWRVFRKTKRLHEISPSEYIMHARHNRKEKPDPAIIAAQHAYNAWLRERQGKSHETIP